MAMNVNSFGAGDVQPLMSATDVVSIMEAAQYELTGQLCDSVGSRLELIARLRERLAIAARLPQSIISRLERCKVGAVSGEAPLGSDLQSAERLRVELAQLGLDFDLSGPTRYPVIVVKPNEPGTLTWMTYDERQALENNPLQTTSGPMDDAGWSDLTMRCPQAAVVSMPSTTSEIRRIDAAGHEVTYICLDKRAMPLVRAADIDVLLGQSADIDRLAQELQELGEDTAPYVEQLELVIAGTDDSVRGMRRDIERLNITRNEENRRADIRATDLRHDNIEPPRHLPADVPPPKPRG